MQILTAFLLTTIAGMSTGIGSVISLLAKRVDTRVLSASLGLSAGVMIYVSFMELLPESRELLGGIYEGRLPEVYSLLAFFAGIGLIALIDNLIPEDENPHEINYNADGHKPAMKRSALMTALAIGIHNFPEGLATFTSALSSIEIALPIVVAIAIHNIPEGIAVSAPLYYATGSRKKAFLLSFLSGMAEPVGALIGYLFLLPFWSDTLQALLLAVVSGIMVYISFDELLPGTQRFGHHHWGVWGVISGMAVMAGSLLLF